MTHDRTCRWCSVAIRLCDCGVDNKRPHWVSSAYNSRWCEPGTTSPWHTHEPKDPVMTHDPRPAPTDPIHRGLVATAATIGAIIWATIWATIGAIIHAIIWAAR